MSNSKLRIDNWHFSRTLDTCPQTPEALAPQVPPVSPNAFCASLPLKDVCLYPAIKSSAYFWKFSGSLFIYKNK